MPKPICVKCGLFFKPKRSGIAWEEGKPADSDPWKPGAVWTPYKLWVADLHECRGCGTEIIVGHGQQPVAEHYEPSYAATRARYRPLLTVNDC